MLTSTFNLPQACWLRNGAIALIPDGTGVVPPPNVHVVVGSVRHCRNIWSEGCQPLPKWWTPAPVVRPHQLEFRIVTSRDRIKNNYTIKRCHALSSLTLQTLDIHMSPGMWSMMNRVTPSWSNDKHRFMNDVCIVALAGSCPFSLWLHFGVIRANWNTINIQVVCIMIRLNVAGGST
jgi:hypothetical protein